MEVLGFGIEPEPTLLQWQCWILNPLCHKKTPSFSFSHPIAYKVDPIWISSQYSELNISDASHLSPKPVLAPAFPILMSIPICSLTQTRSLGIISESFFSRNPCPYAVDHQISIPAGYHHLSLNLLPKGPSSQLMLLYSLLPPSIPLSTVRVSFLKCYFHCILQYLKICLPLASYGFKNKVPYSSCSLKSPS